MKLFDLQKLIDDCVESAQDCNPDVVFYYGKSTELEIREVTQFGIVPDVTLTMKKVKYVETK